MFKLIYRESLCYCKTIYCNSYEQAIEYCRMLAEDNKPFRLYHNSDLIAKSRCFTNVYFVRYFTWVHLTDKARKQKQRSMIYKYHIAGE